MSVLIIIALACNADSHDSEFKDKMKQEAQTSLSRLDGLVLLILATRDICETGSSFSCSQWVVWN